MTLCNTRRYSEVWSFIHFSAQTKSFWFYFTKNLVGFGLVWFLAHHLQIVLISANTKAGLPQKEHAIARPWLTAAICRAL